MPFTANTRSTPGSVSKLFTCAAVMQLVEQGKIGLDEPLSTYLAEFSVKTNGWDAAQAPDTVFSYCNLG